MRAGEEEGTEEKDDVLEVKSIFLYFSAALHIIFSEIALHPR